MKMSTYEDIQDDANRDAYWEQMREKAYRQLNGDPQNYEPWMAEYLEED